MEKLVDLLKIIAEKCLVQTGASVALAILGVAFLPNLLDMTDKVGKILYGVLIFCLGFLLIQGAKQIYTIAKNKAAEKNKKRLSDELRKREADENEAEAIEQLWDYVDSLKLQDRYYLSEFLKTDNQPIEVMGEAFGLGLLATVILWLARIKNKNVLRHQTGKLSLKDILFSHRRMCHICPILLQPSYTA